MEPVRSTIQTNSRRVGANMIVMVQSTVERAPANTAEVVRVTES